jgi:cation transport ATPase
MATPSTVGWTEKILSHVGGTQTVKNIGVDAGISAFFALGGYLTSDDGPLKDASPATKRLLNAVFAAPVAGKILLPDLLGSWKERNVPDFLMTALTTVIGAMGAGMNDREMINSAAMLATLFAIAGHLEDGIIEKNQAGIDALEATVPARAVRRQLAGVEEVGVADVKVGDQLVVKAGETIPVDASVKEVHLNGKPQSIGAVTMPRALHGEAMQVPVQMGEKIPQGAVVAEGTHLVIEAAASAEESTIMRNVSYLRAAEEVGAKSVHSIEHVVKHAYIPVMMAACAAQFVASYYHGKREHKLKGAIDRLKHHTKRTLGLGHDEVAPSLPERSGPPPVIEQPQALQSEPDAPPPPRSLGDKMQRSTKKTAELAIKMAPCAIAAGMLILPFLKNRLAAQHGVLVREDAALERAKNITHILTDIRGTLTRGIAEYRGAHLWNDALQAFERVEHAAEHELLALIGKAEAGSTHPLGQALRRTASERGIDLSTDIGVAITQHPGKGVVAKLGDSHSITVGSHGLLMQEHGISNAALKQQAESQFDDVVYFHHNGKTGIIEMMDPLRDGAAEAINHMRRQGKKVVLVSGMPEASAKKIMARLNPEQMAGNPLELRAGQSYLGAQGISGKDDVVREFLGAKGDKRVLATVGDGENDAPFMALVKQHGGVSFAIGSTGAAATKDVASMVVEGIHQVPEIMAVSRKLSHALMMNIGAAGAWMSFLIGSHVLGKEMKPEKASIAHEAPTILLAIASLAQSFHLSRNVPVARA